MHEHTFPRVKRKILQLNSECLISTFAKPNLQQIEESITKAKKDAIELSTQCGMALEKYEDSHIVRNTVQITEEAVRNDCEENSSSQELQVESTNEIVLPHDEVKAINEDLHQLKVTKSTSLYGLPTYKAPAESTDLSEDPRGKQTAKHFALTKNAKCAFVRYENAKCAFVRYENAFIRKCTALYLIQENYQVSSDRLIRVRSEQPDHLFSNSESTSGPQKSVKSGDLCVFKRIDQKKYIVGRVIQFSYLLGNKRERQYSANYVDLSKDSYKTIGVFANWYIHLVVMMSTYYLLNHSIMFSPLVYQWNNI